MNILIVDDHQLIRTGLKELLADTFTTADIFEADNGTSGLAIAGAQELKLAVVDLFLPGEKTFQFIRKLCDLQPALPVLVLSASDSGAHIRKCVDLGVQAFVNKAASQSELLTAIETILAGGMSIPCTQNACGASYRSEEGMHSISMDQLINTLTDRQLEVLTLLTQGKSNKEIARLCQLSENTIKVHVSAILRGLALSNRTQLGLLGQQLGLTGSIDNKQSRV